MRLSSTITGLTVLGVAVAAWAAMPGPESPQTGQPAFELTAVKRRGDLEIRTSLRGRPIVTASGLVPGTSASGWIKVSNGDEDRVVLRLATRNKVDSPGPNGGHLAEVLQVRISQISRRPPSSLLRRTIYSGSLAALGRVRLKSLAPGAKRTYEFRVTMPDGGLTFSPSEGDNRYQGATAGADFVWVAVARR